MTSTTQHLLTLPVPRRISIRLIALLTALIAGFGLVFGITAYLQGQPALQSAPPEISGQPAVAGIVLICGDDFCDVPLGERSPNSPYYCPQDCPAPEEKPGPSPFVDPLDDPDAASAPGPNGALPCGLATVNHWEHNVFDLAEFPNCTPPDLTVYCLDNAGNWNADHVADVVVSVSNNTVAFQASQQGTCGLFPTGTSAQTNSGLFAQIASFFQSLLHAGQ